MISQKSNHINLEHEATYIQQVNGMFKNKQNKRGATVLKSKRLKGQNNQMQNMDLMDQDLNKPMVKLYFETEKSAYGQDIYF